MACVLIDRGCLLSAYQYFQRFITLLDDLLQLTVLSPLMTKTQALDALHDLAKATIFQVQQPTTPTTPPPGGGGGGR